MNEPRPQNESELIDFVRSIDVPAPAALHGQVEALVSEHPRRGPRRRGAASSTGRVPSRAWALGGAAALAVVAVALVVGLSGGGASSVSVRAASALTVRPATMGAPAENPRNGAQLAVAVDGVAFPYWGGRLGWRATGARSDRIGGRTVTTVFYSDGRGRRMGYAIVAGTPAPRLSGGVVVWRGTTPYRLLDEDGVQVVTWLRDGRLCVLSGRGVDYTALLRLASWSGPPAAAS